MTSRRSSALASPLVTRRQWATLTAASLVAVGTSRRAMAQATAWPTKPIKLVVAYPPGGVSDAVARALAERLAVRLHVPVLVDNKPGASGGLGVQAVSRSAPDGLTLAFSAVSPLTLSPHLGPPLFDPIKGVTPVASVMYSPVLILATSAAPDADLPSLIARARAKPGAVRWATSGPASLGHVILEQLRAAAHVDITHIPYKGGGPQITDALSGQFEVLSVNTSAAVLQHMAAGKLRALAVGAPSRLDSLPKVPTLAEAGWPAANLSSSFGVFAPGGTPAAIVERLHQEIDACLAEPALRERLQAAECVPLRQTTAEFARQLDAESQSMARIVREAQIRGD